MIGSYFKFLLLPEDVRTSNKIRSKARLDCITYAVNVAESHKGLTYFVNAKGQLFFYKTPCRDFIDANSKRIAEWSLTNSSINFSSIYIEDLDYPEIGFGYPNANRFLSNGSINPLFNYRNEGYLFLLNQDYSEIELLIIPDGRNLITSYYQKMIDGGFDDEVRDLRKQAKPFFKYDGLVL
ncbi:MAG TPA: hypothetical protein PLG47_05370 [Candidatus Dojkabacteria bacterium]|nr:hypothetical protein [Candidatus Dojkabacteria bacterium]